VGLSEGRTERLLLNSPRSKSCHGIVFGSMPDLKEQKFGPADTLYLSGPRLAVMFRLWGPACAHLDLRERRPSPLVATAAEERLSFEGRT
jgi:hypothetical protein